jgi:hypothetical protein
MAGASAGAPAGAPAAKKTAAKKTAAKRAPAKKTAAKKTAAKRAPAKKTAAKKTAAPSTPPTESEEKAEEASEETPPTESEEKAEEASEEESEEEGPRRNYLDEGLNHDVTQTGAGIILGILSYAVLVNYLRGGLPQVRKWFRAKFLNVDTHHKDFTQIPGVHEIPMNNLGSAVNPTPLTGGTKK